MSVHSSQSVSSLLSVDVHEKPDSTTTTTSVTMEVKEENIINKEEEAKVQQQCPKRQSWRIEDYDFEPAPAEEPTIMSRLFKRLSSGTFETVSSILSNMALETDQLHPTSHQYSRRRSHEATTDEVKRAALSLCLHNRRASS